MGDPSILLAPAAAILVAAVAGFFKLLHNISSKFASLGEKIDQIMDAHERRDQDRHEENVQRLTRLETLVNGYNGRGRKRQ